MACVVILASKGFNPYFRVGKACVDLLESEESAANDCLQLLVTTFRLYVRHIAMLDINMALSFAGKGGLEDEREICIYVCDNDMAKARCEQCDKLNINMMLSLANDHVAGRGGLEDEREICIHACHACEDDKAKSRCEQCDKLDINVTLSLASDHVAGKGVLEDERNIYVHASEGECTTPTDPAYQLVCSSIPPPLKKSSVSRNHGVDPPTVKLIRLHPDFPSFLRKRKRDC